MNRLADETSPYLRQHADNPVDWHPWSAEALALARDQDRPILLSIGYSACHWCHVMAHESFEDGTTSALMNAHFINIKVDREERPDLDRIYQTAHQLLTRNRGGWPLTMFLTPDDQMPFFGGTYFPREPRHGLPGFKDVLVRIATAYREHHGQIAQYKSQMRTALAEVMSGSYMPALVLSETPIADAAEMLSESFDHAAAGFGGAPKFPHPSSLEFLLALYARSPSAAAESHLHMVTQTLSAMAAGGIFDHLAGGFCRYSVDAGWTIPHFEKMLYDNGPLLTLYCSAWQITGDDRFRDVALATAHWVMREMRSPGGSFYASLDADSEGEEGRFYVWSREEIATLLGPDFALFAQHYGVNGPPNFEGSWHLRLAPLAPATVRPTEVDVLQRARATLLAERNRRVRPAHDDKCLVSWNALMIQGLAICGRLLRDDACIDAAIAAVQYIERVHWRDGRLLATSSHGRAALNAYLDDYAFLCLALLELLRVRWDARWLRFASALAEALLVHFEDDVRGGFYFTSHDHEVLLERSKTYADDALPAGNAIAARALLELGHLLGEMRYVDAAERCLKAGAPAVAASPVAHAAMLTTLIDFIDPASVVILRGDDDAALAAWQTAIDALRNPRIRCYALPARDTSLPGLLNARVASPGAAVTAYLCAGTTCHAPVTDLHALALLISPAAHHSSV